MSDETATQAIVPYRAIVRYKDSPRYHRMVGMWVIGIVVLLVVLAIAGCAAFNQKPQEAPRVGGTNAVISSPTTTAPATTWKLAYSDYGQSRWFTDGITEIKTAKTATESAEAAQVWLNRVKPDPNLLVAAAKDVLERDVDSTTLFKDGWATPVAVQLVAEMQLALAKAKIVPEDAPQNGRNSGVSNNTVVSSRFVGISGNRKAIRVTFANGRVIWILARCGNIVTKGQPHFPPGKTDEKDPSRDPFPRGNATTGGGKNLDSGPGTYIPPIGMVHPPASPRVNPLAPKPTAPPAGSKPDPTPAPAPDAPAIGYSPAPGTK